MNSRSTYYLVRSLCIVGCMVLLVGLGGGMDSAQRVRLERNTAIVHTSGAYGTQGNPNESVVPDGESNAISPTIFSRSGTFRFSEYCTPDVRAGAVVIPMQAYGARTGGGVYIPSGRYAIDLAVPSGSGGWYVVVEDTQETIVLVSGDTSAEGRASPAIERLVREAYFDGGMYYFMVYRSEYADTVANEEMPCVHVVPVYTDPME